MRELYISKNGISARVHEWGRLENPTIICLHSLGSTTSGFTE